ncbi:DUF6155 family protein [Longimicrobium sp.]|uniref:DUF6155 family protein n=1 Tax=Longimicrobium sp. TaxID=2029185 RepID=UPI002E360250|nr:DUF6155 family protein [Longimicrobium sp.]HEX6039214.1 DUF6155 family protein [Longimicrobium sp.]
MAKPIGRRELKKHLQGLSREQLVNHLLHLGESFKDVQAYLQNVVRPADDETVRARYRQVIKNEFFPARGYGRARLAVARKAVMDYRKVAASAEGPADLMLAYVELGVQFTNAYGDMSEAFYRSMESMYGNALQWIVKHGLKDGFRPRAEAILDDTRNIGWSFPDILNDIFCRYLDDEDENGE